MEAKKKTRLGSILTAARDAALSEAGEAAKTVGRGGQEAATAYRLFERHLGELQAGLDADTISEDEFLDVVERRKSELRKVTKAIGLETARRAAWGFFDATLRFLEGIAGTVLKATGLGAIGDALGL